MTWNQQTDCTVRDTGSVWFETREGVGELHIRDRRDDGGAIERVYIFSPKAVGEIAQAMIDFYMKAAQGYIDELVDHIQRLEYPFEEHGGVDE